MQRIQARPVSKLKTSNKLLVVYLSKKYDNGGSDGEKKKTECVSKANAGAG